MSDLKKMLAEIRGALDQYPREQLQEILTWVFKEYVIEGGAAPAQGALAMLDARTELEGLSFAELVRWLQLHLDVPELAAFDVQGARVSVRAGGRAIPIEVAAPPAMHAPAAAGAPLAATTPPSAIPPPQPMPPPNPTASSHATPPPTTTTPPLSPTTPPATTPATTPPTTSAADATKGDDKKDDAASRFSWLEVD